MSEYVSSPASKLARLPDNIDFDTAARIGYMGTSFAGLLRGNLRERGSVLINGVTGTLGVAAVQIALGLGAQRILGIGRRPDILAQVKALAPDRVDVTTYDAETIVDWVKTRTGGRGADVLYDCLGAGSSADWTSHLLKAVAREGHCILVAAGAQGKICQDYLDTRSNPVHIAWSSWFTSGEIDDFIDLLADGSIDVSSVRTQAFPLERINDAVAFAAARPGGFVNVAVHP